MEPRECGDGAPLCAAVSDVISGVSIGWNLGNSYDCHGTWFDNVRTETAWGNPLVTRDFVHFVAGLGFTAMRIPVTWYPHMDEDGTIDGEWLRRVRRVVRMVIAEGMVCILDMKHDTGGMRSYGGGRIRATKANFAQYRERVETMVRQVAEYFSQESDRLILGGFDDIMNEECETEMPSAEELEVVNDWNRLFVTTVRSTGGGNATRNLIVSPYGSGVGPYILSGFRLPEDSVPGHLAVGVNLYAPQGFTSRAATWSRQTVEFDCRCEEELERAFTTLDELSAQVGVPVIVGEFGAMDRANDDARAIYAASVVDKARRRGIPCFVWDDGKGYGLLNRDSRTIRFPGIIGAMKAAATMARES